VNDLAIPTADCDECAGDLHGVFGIGHPNRNYDMQLAYDRTRSLLPNLIPFGYDQGNGMVFIDPGKNGQVVFTPWDELVGEPPIPTYYVADSIERFLEEAVKLTERLNADS
jgi:hypothetical protein